MNKIIKVLEGAVLIAIVLIPIGSIIQTAHAGPEYFISLKCVIKAANVKSMNAKAKLTNIAANLKPFIVNPCPDTSPDQTVIIEADTTGTFTMSIEITLNNNVKLATPALGCTGPYKLFVIPPPPFVYQKTCMLTQGGTTYGSATLVTSVL